LSCRSPEGDVAGGEGRARWRLLGGHGGHLAPRSRQTPPQIGWQISYVERDVVSGVICAL
jgi:hypothetical protein